MSQFTFSWDVSDLINNPNILGQNAMYRYKSIGGAFITSGFNPGNPLVVSNTTVDTPALDDNRVVEFKVQAFCTDNGPADNDNGIKEAIEFGAVPPTLTKTTGSGTITVSMINTDITKVRFTLRRTSDNVVMNVSVVNVAANAATVTVAGLAYSTNYYWQMEYYANVDNVEVVSSSTGYSGVVFSPYPFTTNAPLVCNPPTLVSVSSIETS